VEHVGEGDVIDVTGLAGDFGAAFLAGDGGANDRGSLHLSGGLDWAFGFRYGLAACFSV